MASTMPSVSETSDAVTNQPTAFMPMRPTVRVSPVAAIPDTTVAKTSGAMIILIRRRKISARMEKYPAMLAADAASSAKVLAR